MEEPEIIAQVKQSLASLISKALTIFCEKFHLSSNLALVIDTNLLWD